MHNRKKGRIYHENVHKPLYVDIHVDVDIIVNLFLLIDLFLEKDGIPTIPKISQKNVVFWDFGPFSIATLAIGAPKAFCCSNDIFLLQHQESLFTGTQ